MAKINNQAVMQKLIDELKLYPGKDLIPSELADKILATYQINDTSINFKEEGTPRYIKAQTAGNVINTLTVPANMKWRLDLFSFKLVTDATVATRHIRVQIKDDAGNLIMEGCNNESGNDARIIASKTNIYNLSNTNGMNGVSIAGEESIEFSAEENDAPITYNFKLPLMNKNLVLPEGWSINIAMYAGVVGDTIDAYAQVNEADNNFTS